MNNKFKNRQTKVKDPNNIQHAYDYAVFLLSLRLRTMGEVLEKMKKRGYAENVISEVVDRLKEKKYLDDQRYAEIFLENLKTYRHFGYYGIKKKFMEKKLPTDLIERVLDEGYTKGDELEVAKRFLKKEDFQVKTRSSNYEEVHYSSYGETEQKKEKQKMANRMKSRGFRGDVISRLLF